MQKIFLVSFAAALIGVSSVAMAASSSPVQMLPPQDYSGAPCTGVNAGLLAWDGVASGAPMRCVPNTKATEEGEVTFGTAVQVGDYKPGVTTCAANEGGKMRYNSALHIMEYCNGSAWVGFSTGFPRNSKIDLGWCHAKTDAKGSVTMQNATGAWTPQHFVWMPPSNQGCENGWCWTAVLSCMVDTSGMTMIAYNWGVGKYGFAMADGSQFAPWGYSGGSGDLPVIGHCGEAAGVPTDVAPTTGLCAAGRPSAVTVGKIGLSDYWQWTCASSSGFTSASCSAPKVPTPPPPPPTTGR